MVQDVVDKTVVITGASSGFGRGAALELARRGAVVVLGARREDLLADVAEECRALGGRAYAVATDVRLRDDMEKLGRAALSETGRIDVWINNAGVGALGAFEEVPIDIHEDVIATNLLGTLYGSYYAWRVFLEQGAGTLINVSAAIGVCAVPYYASYAASKQAIVGLCQALRQELAQRRIEGVHVCLVLPATHDTPFFDHVANYTRHEVHAPGPLHDPQAVVDTLVKLARHPKDETIVGADGVVKVFLKRLAPRTAEALVGRQLHRAQFEQAQADVDTPGAVRYPISAGAGVSAGRRTEAERGRRD
jgi:short-subunit dehydrogenase